MAKSKNIPVHVSPPRRKPVQVLTCQKVGDSLDVRDDSSSEPYYPFDLMTLLCGGQLPSRFKGGMRLDFVKGTIEPL